MKAILLICIIFAGSDGYLHTKTTETEVVSLSVCNKMKTDVDVGPYGGSVHCVKKVKP